MWVLDPCVTDGEVKFRWRKVEPCNCPIWKAVWLAAPAVRGAP